MPHDQNPKPSRSLLNANARGRALVELSRRHRAEYRQLYLQYKRELYEKVGLPLSRRHVKHKDPDNTGFCQTCGFTFPCPSARRRIASHVS
jgi:hypothetical protein